MSAYKEIENAYMRNMFAGNEKKDSLIDFYLSLEDKNITDDGEKNLYHLAARFFDHKAVEYLGSENIKPRPDEDGNTPLHEVIRSPYCNDATNFRKMEEDIFSTVKALIDLGVNPKKKNDNGKLAYMEAGKLCMYPFIKAIAETETKMHAVEDEQKNLLHIITDVLYHRKSVNGFSENAYDTLKILLESGFPDPEDKDIFGNTPLYYAQKSEVKEIAALISGDESDVNTGGMTLNQAVLNNDIEAVTALLEQGADPQEISDDKRTPLMYACEYPRPEIVKLLLKYKADPNFVVGETGSTAMSFLLTQSIHNLGRGFKGGNQPPKDIRSILRMLLDGETDPNTPLDQQGNTPLIYVANMDYFAGLNNSLAEELIEGGADVNKSNLSGHTPLMIFALKGDEPEHSLAELLLDNNANPSFTDAWSNTALMYAASNTNKISGKKIASLILDSGYKELNRVNNAGQTAMDIAVTQENESLVKLLIENM